MKAAVYRTTGAPEVLSYEEVADPVAGDDQVLVHVKAISIEGGDILARRRTPPGDVPRIPGYSAAGEVVAVGTNVTGLAIGQQVVTFGFDGSHAEFRAAPAATTWVLPPGLDLKVAATVPCGLGTASHALSLGRFAQGQTVLIQGATGGVGLAAVQLAHSAGARVIGTGLRADWLEAVKPYGLDDAIVVGETPVHKQVKALVGRKGVDLLVDCVGGEAFGHGLLAVREGGHAVIVGVMGSGRAEIDATHLVMTRKTIAGCFLGLVMHEPDIHAMIADLLVTVARGELEVPISAVYPLSEVVAAHARAEQGGNVGRVVMTA